MLNVLSRVAAILNKSLGSGYSLPYAIVGSTALILQKVAWHRPLSPNDLDILLSDLKGFPAARTSTLAALEEEFSITVEKTEENSYYVLDGVKVQLLYSMHSLMQEGFQNAEIIDYEGIKIRTFRLEYLVASLMASTESKHKTMLRRIIIDPHINEKATEIYKAHKTSINQGPNF